MLKSITVGFAMMPGARPVAFSHLTRTANICAVSSGADRNRFHAVARSSRAVLNFHVALGSAGGFGMAASAAN